MDETVRRDDVRRRVGHDARKTVCHIRPRTEEYSTSREVKTRRVTQNLEQGPGQSTTGGITSNDDILRVDRTVLCAGGWVDEIQPCS